MTAPRPATEGDLDHREARPIGATDPTNLWPGCRTDHRTKHAPGFGIEQAEDGTFTLRTAAGFSHPISQPTHPVSDDWTTPEVPDRGFQSTATELVRALEDIRLWDDLMRPWKPEQHWETEVDEALTHAEREASYLRAHQAS